MNRLFILIMALLGIASCANGQNGKTDMKGKKILVAYYSWGGNTKAVGDYIAQKTGADVCRIEPVKAYPTDYEACVNEVNRHGSTYKPELKPIQANVAEYDVIFVGAPCWWGTIANPLRTFLHRNSFKGKTVIPFMTNGTSGKRLQDVKKLCTGATVLDGLSIYNRYQVETKVNTPDNMGDWKTAVDEWLKTVIK